MLTRPTQNQHDRAHIEHGAAHLANTALQIVRKIRLHHHGEPKIHLALGDGNATARMDVRLVGCLSNLRFACSVFSRFFALRVFPWKISVNDRVPEIVCIISMREYSE
ncbi:hypothetical protein [Verminephrobacter eiseniae]|uniref:hypothetical protein n=1 Tax=Verminephrobacter eiseniae TaxID=364317 RepID=UPI00223827D8|nr:hypothetical protein [Verminephrobacter eiseniae]